MLCPFCKSENIKVVDTRKYETVNLRVRFCARCRTAFQTQEEYFVSPKNLKTAAEIKFPK